LWASGSKQAVWVLVLQQLAGRVCRKQFVDPNKKAQLSRTSCSCAEFQVFGLQNVATISAGNDRVIGDMIAEALDKVRLAC
jgi:hypothetical protein